MAKAILQEVDDALQELERRHQQAVDELLTPLIRREFKRARRANPKLKRIIFGNGTYLLDGVQNLVHRDYHRDLGGYTITTRTPKYLERLVELCDRLEGMPIEDILP